MTTRQRYGFTVLELLIVLAIFAVVTAIALPKFSQGREQSNMLSAKAQVTSGLSTAKAAAVRRGGGASFYTDGSRIWAVAWQGSGGTLDTVLKPKPIDEIYGISLGAGARDSIRFDSRGFASNLAGRRVIRLTGSSRRDSICVTQMGAVLSGGCF